MAEEVRDYLERCRTLHGVLRERFDALGLGHDAARMRNAELAVALLEELHGREGVALVEALA